MMAPPAPRTALITGASRGIGRHLVLGFAAGGFDVGLVATSPDVTSAATDSPAARATTCQAPACASASTAPGS